MKRFLILSALLFLSQNIFSQNLDSLYNLYVNIKSGENLTQGLPPQSNNQNTDHHNHLVEKCGFGLNAQIRGNLNNFSIEQQQVLRKLLFTRPTSDTSIVTPSGKFRIHFHLSGSNKPNYSGINFEQGANTLGVMIDSVAAALDFSYDYEINTLGFPEPPGDNGGGGDNLYDIYIKNLPSGFYGETVPEDGLGEGKFTSYIVIDNDFVGNYNTSGIDGARVTIAHELHHGIQIGNYIYRESDLYYYEVTSTAMEEFVYDDINDYYAYILGYFNSPDRPFINGSGYDFALWNIFLQQRFGNDIIKRIWELMVNQKALKAIASAIFENGSSFKTEMNTFGLWTYFTNYRSANTKFFEEAENYPVIKPLITRDFTDSPKTLTINSKPASNNFLMFPILTGNFSDTLVAIVTNADIENGTDSPNTTLSFDFSLFNQPTDGGVKIINNYYSKIVSSNDGLLAQSNVFNNEPVDGGNINREEIDYAFPQPFNYGRHNSIYIPTVANPGGEAYLNVYTSSMDLVFTGLRNILSGDKITVSWNGMDEKNEKLPSGVYIYVTKSGDTIKKGKIVIYNE